MQANKDGSCGLQKSYKKIESNEDNFYFILMINPCLV